MAITRFKRLRQSLEELFPERHLYVRSGGEMRGYVFSTNKQLLCATGVAAAALWMGVCTAAMMVNALSVSSTDQMVIKQKAYYERLNADRQARLNSAVAQLSASSGSLDELASSVEKRHAALALLVSDFKGVPGAAQALTDRQAARPGRLAPVERIQATRMDQERLIDAAETFAKSRAERLRLAMRMAGLDAGSFTGRGGSSLGGPLIEAKDPRALAAVLDVDEDFASRIQHAATDMSDMRQLSAASQKLPFYRPTNNPALSQLRRPLRPVHPSAGLPFGPGLPGRLLHADHGDGPGRHLVHRRALGLRQRRRDRPRRRLQDPLRPLGHHRRPRRRARGHRQPHRGHGLDRSLDRSASALRSLGQR
jgi:hypothetical protein